MIHVCYRYYLVAPCLWFDDLRLTHIYFTFYEFTLMMLERWFPIGSQVGLSGVITNNSAKLAKANFGGITKGMGICFENQRSSIGCDQIFHMKVEKDTWRQLKCVHANNGGEYRGPFGEYCKNNGIRLKKTVPKDPQHNDIAKRMNRIICERIMCMLSHAKLPKHFWREAMRIVVDLINLSPLVPLDGDIPQRIWTRKDVSFEHLWVFGCRAFIHIPRDERSKLYSKVKQCIFMV